MGEPRIITLPWPDKALQSNSRTHWAAKSRATKTARNMAWAVATQKPRIACMPDALIFIEYYPKAFRGDIHNVPSSLKAYIDGIADAMGCDDKAFRVDYPSVWAGKSDPGKVVFRVVPRIASVPIIGAING